VFITNAIIGRGNVIGADLDDVVPAGACLSEGFLDVVERLDDLLLKGYRR
jgi:hypothetical protein